MIRSPFPCRGAVALSLLLAWSLSLVGTAFAAGPAAYLHLSTGNQYAQDDSQSPSHVDTAALGLGRQGRRLATAAQITLRTDAHAALCVDTQLRLLRLGPLSLHLKGEGEVGLQLDGSGPFTSAVAAGPQLDLHLFGHTFSAWGTAGFHGLSSRRLPAPDVPQAAAGAAISPQAGNSGLQAAVTYRVTEEEPQGALATTWAGSIGYRWSLG